MAPGRDLAEQRVTLIGDGLDLKTWMDGLRDLLSAPPDGSVFWAKIGEGKSWRLETGSNRKALASRLSQIDQEYLAQYIKDRIRWAHEAGFKKLEQAGEERRSPALHLLVPLLMIESFGPEGQARLLESEPTVLSCKRFLDGPHKDLFREWMGRRHFGGPTRAPADLDRYWLVLTRERHAFDPLYAGFTISFIRPSGFMSSTGNLSGLRFLHNRVTADRRAASLLAGLSFPLEDETPQMPRATLNLTPEPHALPGQKVTRTREQLLVTVAERLGVSIIADGYLRSSVELPANLELKEIPVRRLLSRLAETWNCDWRYLDKDEKRVLLRAKYWWLEDEADVPETQLADLRSRFRPGQPAELEDLLRLAELKDSQVRKLTEDAGICAGAQGLLPRGMHTGTGVKPCLQFFSRLPKTLQARALSPAGLPLAEVSPQLVEAHLRRTLVVWVGAVTPELREKLVFFLAPLPPTVPDGKPAGYQVAIRSANRPGPNWWYDVRLPAKLIYPPGVAPRD